MNGQHAEERGTGILIPQDLWDAALSTMQKGASRCVSPQGDVLRLGFPLIAVELKSGRVVRGVVVSWDREILHRSTDLKGPGPEWTTEGLDFKSEDIVAIGVLHKTLGGLFKSTKWFKR